jgi:hypothetical protein
MVATGKDDQISMVTRSMLQIMQEMAALVQVPASDVADGRASPGAVGDAPPGAPASPTTFKIQTGMLRQRMHMSPFHTMAIGSGSQTRIFARRFFFGTVMILFSVSETGPQSNAPVVTVPAN